MRNIQEFHLSKLKNHTGKNTGRIFRELDVIRRKQINLASDHVSLEAITDIP